MIKFELYTGFYGLDLGSNLTCLFLFLPNHLTGGFVPPGTTFIEKRAIAATVPVWKSENCTQCNICSFVCPHAAIRPFLSQASERQGAPDGYTTLQAKGSGLEGLKYRIQVSPYDCTGCQLCVVACPDDALQAKPIEQVLSIEDTNW